MALLTELTNNVKFKVDYRPLVRLKSRLRDLNKENDKLRRNMARPLVLKIKADTNKIKAVNTQVKKLKTQIAKPVSLSVDVGTDRLRAVETRVDRLKQKISEPVRMHVDTSMAGSRRRYDPPPPMASGGVRRAPSGGGGGMGGAAAYAVFETGRMAGSGAMGMAKSLFNTNVEMARLEGALKTTMGSASAADVQFKKLQKFANDTPFGLKQSIQAFIKLKNLGLDPSERALRSYGNTSTAMGKSMMDMIEAVADASTGEFERLKEFGIKSKAEGDNVEFTFQNVKTKVKKDAKSIEEYLMKIGETKFAKAMSDQMNSLPGMVSVTGDAFENLALAIGKAGMNDALIPILRDISNFVSQIDAAPLGEAIGKGLTNGVALLKQGGAFIADLVSNLGGIDGVARIAGAALTVMMAPIVGQQILSAVAGIQKIAGVIRGLTAMSAAQGVFALIGGWPLLIGAAAIALGFLAVDIYKFATGGESVIGKLAAKFPMFADFVKMVGDAFKSLSPQLQPLQDVVGQVVSQGIEFFKTLGQVIMTAFIAAAPVVMGLLNILIQVGVFVASLVISFVTFQARVILAFLQIATAVLGVLGSIGGAIAVFVGVAIGFVLNMVASWIGAVFRFMAAVINVFTTIAGAIVGFAGAMMTLLIQLFTQPGNAANNFRNTVFSIVEQIKGAFANLVNSVVGLFRTGFGIIGSIIGGLMGQANNLISKVRGARAETQRTSAALPGRAGSSFSTAFYLGGNTYNVGGDTDPMMLGAMVNRQTTSGIYGALSDMARTTPRMVPGVG